MESKKNNKIWVIWDEGNELWISSDNLEISDEPLYPIGTKIKIIEPAPSTYENVYYRMVFKNKVLEFVKQFDTYFEAEDKSGKRWEINNLTKCEVVEEPKEYEKYQVTDYNSEIDVDLSSLNIIEDDTIYGENLQVKAGIPTNYIITSPEITEIASELFLSDSKDSENNNKGDDLMENLEGEFEILNKNGGYLVRVKVDDYESEGIDEKGYLEAFSKALNETIDKMEMEERKELQIESIKSEIENLEERLETLQEG
ncbi:MAG: hypothetical protein ACOC1K_03670 [Nanoarchaeota archaeon]